MHVDERREIEAYFNGKSPGDPAVHVEKAATENVSGQLHDVWDVHTATGRWWVVTNPTNLYTQEDFKSRDVVLTFHIGLTVRVASQYRVPINEGPTELFDEGWARWQRAVDALTSASAPEDFQSVSLRLRETLVSLLTRISDESLLAQGASAPKAASREWFALYATTIAPGHSHERLRTYLTSLGETTWDLVQKVTHRRTAAHMDAEIAVAAVSHLLSTYTAAWMRWVQDGNWRCTECGCYQASPRLPALWCRRAPSRPRDVASQ